MISFRVFLFPMSLLVLSDTAQCRRLDCKTDCCSFVEDFPVRLKELRSLYKKILPFYDSNDDLDVLLDDSVQQNINGPYGCHVVHEILRFYLETVLPTAMKINSDLKLHIDSIENIFLNLKNDMLKCRNYLSCQKPFEISSIRDSYEKMEEKGLYKAMGELDLLFKYMEQYVASKRVKH